MSKRATAERDPRDKEQSNRPAQSGREMIEL